MGKNYAESSLKRFLKRKVKITLGVVVSFLITGMVAFAEGTENILDEHNKDFITAENSLTGLGQYDLVIGNGEIVIDKGDTNKKIKITENNGEYKITYGGINTFPWEDKNLKNPTISKDMLSEKTVNNINKFLNSQNKEYVLTENSITDEIKENQFIQNNTSGKAAQQATGTNNITNNGYILATRGQLVENGKAINNGIIFTKGNPGLGYVGQTATGTGELYNYGYIGLSSFAQSVKNGNAYNYGTVVTEFAQQSTGTGNLYNYGFLKATNSGNEYYGQQVRNSSAYNYGIVEAYRGSQNISGTGKLYNYGTLIATGTNGEAQVSKGGRGENYGLIKVQNGLGMKGTGTLINRGVIHSSDSSNIFDTFNGKSDNTGIIITNADLSDKEWSKTGVTLNTNYELQNKNGVTIIGGTLNTDSFEGKNIGYINATDRTSSIKISDIRAGQEKDEKGNTIKKVIGVVAEDKNTQDDKKPVVFEAGGNLLLEELYMTGYLVNGGTLIDMKNNDLILSNANITVTEDLTQTKGEKAVAVNLGTGKLSLMGSSEINGIIKGEAGSVVESVAQKSEDFKTEGETVLEFKNAEADIADINYTNINLTGKNAGKIETTFNKTSKDKENTIEIGKDFVLGTAQDYKTETVIEETSKEGNKSNYIIKNLDNIHGNISLGAGENTVTVNSKFEKYDGKIDLGAGEDKFVIEGNKGTDVINTFNHVVYNAETVELNGGVWGNWNEANGSIRFDENTKAEKTPNLTLGSDTTMNITLNADGNHGSDFANYIAKDLDMKHSIITGAGADKGSVVKFMIDKNGLDETRLDTDKYSFKDGTVKFESAIFDVTSKEGTGTSVKIKTAEDMGLSAQYKTIYEAYLNQIKTEKANENVIGQINSFNSSEAFVEHIKGTDITGKAYYTAGSVVTKDIVNSYVSSVEDFTKRAGKGEWLAQGKYINSDTEFDGGSRVKGYDGDITGTVGMIEYGLTENTSYGAVFGQGDAEMDINGGGKLDGDNTYAGLYMKHRTANGIELVGNIGYIKSDMDSELRSDFGFTNIAGQDKVEINDKNFEKGTADSNAVVLSLKGRKDYKVTDTVKLQPVLGARVTFINQDKAENPEMNFTIAEQDIIVVEGTAGMGVAKEFALSQGKFELNAGAEYTFAAANSNNDAEYTLFEGDYQATHIKMDDVDAAENTGTVYAGFDYEHENGVGFNGKYEMMWSDKGDDSRITAGISYRF